MVQTDRLRRPQPGLDGDDRVLTVPVTSQGRRRSVGFSLSALACIAFSVVFLTTIASRADAATDPARIVSEQQIDARTIELTISTPAFTAPTHVDVDLPAGYSRDPGRRWPVLYYLTGTDHHFGDFNADYNGEALTAGFPAIVICPNGDSGYWADWYNSGRFGPPDYETFVIDQLIPLIDATFRTIPTRSERAIMGESMGGYGTMMYAAEHPDLFAAAASLSGAVDTNYVLQGPVTEASPALQLQPPDAIYGPQATQDVRWQGNDPTVLAGNLADVNLQVRSALRTPTPSNLVAGDVEGCVLETAVHAESVDFVQALNSFDVPNVFHVYSAGCHNDALFEQEITDSLPVSSRFRSLSSSVRHFLSEFSEQPPCSRLVC